MSRTSQPIGIFDSGIGGLTVAHAVHILLPHENIIYFGDTAHLPYGDKSAEEIQQYSIKICKLLMEKQCKLILIACNSASSAAYDILVEDIGHKISLLNVIDPVVESLKERYANKTIGLIGTKQTISSNVYQKKIAALNKNITLKSLATPLLAPMIEEGAHHGNIKRELIDEYLSHPSLKNIDALILGCTHYPLIKKEIDAFYEGKVKIIDSSMIVAKALKLMLVQQGTLRENGKSSLMFYISDYRESFLKSARMFFYGSIQLEHYPLW